MPRDCLPPGLGKVSFRVFWVFCKVTDGFSSTSLELCSWHRKFIMGWVSRFLWEPLSQCWQHISCWPGKFGIQGGCLNNLQIPSEDSWKGKGLPVTSVYIFLCLHSIYILFAFPPAPAATSLVLQKEDVCQGVGGSLVYDDVHRLPSTVQFVRAWLQTKPFSCPWWVEFGWTLAPQQSSSCSPFSLASHQLPSISSLSAWAWPPGNTTCLPSLLLLSMHTTSSTTNSKIFWKKVAGWRFMSKEAEIQLSTAHLRRIHSFTRCITIALRKEEVFVLLNLMTCSNSLT